MQLEKSTSSILLVHIKLKWQGKKRMKECDGT